MHRLGGLDTRNFSALEASKSKVKVSKVGLILRPHFLACRRLPSLCVFT